MACVEKKPIQETRLWLQEIRCYRCGSQVYETVIMWCHTIDCPNCGSDIRAIKIVEE